MQFDDPMYTAQLSKPRIVAAFVYDSLGNRWDLPKSSLRSARDPTNFTLPPEVFRRRQGS